MKQFKITGLSVLLILLAILIIIIAIIVVAIKLLLLFLPIILILIGAYLIYRFLFVKQDNKNYGFSDIKIKINNKFRKHKHSKKTSDKKVIDATYREKK